jgi:hypothetical protein
MPDLTMWVHQRPCLYLQICLQAPHASRDALWPPHTQAPDAVLLLGSSCSTSSTTKCTHDPCRMGLPGQPVCRLPLHPQRLHAAAPLVATNTVARVCLRRGLALWPVRACCHAGCLHLCPTKATAATVWYLHPYTHSDTNADRWSSQTHVPEAAATGVHHMMHVVGPPTTQHTSLHPCLQEHAPAQRLVVVWYQSSIVCKHIRVISSEPHAPAAPGSTQTAGSSRC